MRRVTLTDRGRREFAEDDRRSNGFVASVLPPLSHSQQQRLVTAMREVERLLQALAVVIRVRTAPMPAGPFPGTGGALRRRVRRGEEHFRDGQELTLPAGRFLLARLDHAPVDCGALGVETRRIGEVKRVCVAADPRSLGIRGCILASLEQQAQGARAEGPEIETNRALIQRLRFFTASTGTGNSRRSTMGPTRTTGSRKRCGKAACCGRSVRRETSG